MRPFASRIAAVVPGLVVWTAQPVLATYTSIEHYLVDGTPDTNYVGGVLTISQASDNLILSDPVPLGGTITHAVVTLSTTFDSFDPLSHLPFGTATFRGGSLSLTFDYNDRPYSIGGPIGRFDLSVGSAAPLLSVINGECYFDAVTNLPGSNDWPALKFESAILVTIALLDSDLTGFDWSTDWPGSGETLYTLAPHYGPIGPEPASLLLFTLGVAMFRRSR